MVPMSGFDSQPSDLGVFMVADHIKRKYGCGTKNVRNFCEFQGGGSGGTLASIANLVTTSSMKVTFPLTTPSPSLLLLIKEQHSATDDKRSSSNE